MWLLTMVIFVGRWQFLHSRWQISPLTFVGQNGLNWWGKMLNVLLAFSRDNGEFWKPALVWMGSVLQMTFGWCVAHYTTFEADANTTPPTAGGFALLVPAIENIGWWLGHLFFPPSSLYLLACSHKFWHKWWTGWVQSMCWQYSTGSSGWAHLMSSGRIQSHIPMPPNFLIEVVASGSGASIMGVIVVVVASGSTSIDSLLSRNGGNAGLFLALLTSIGPCAFTLMIDAIDFLSGDKRQRRMHALNIGWQESRNMWKNIPGHAKRRCRGEKNDCKT